MDFRLDDVVVLDREVANDNTLSLAAKGMAAWILAQDKDTSGFLIPELVARLIGCTVEVAKLALLELAEYGFLSGEAQTVLVFRSLIEIAVPTETADIFEEDEDDSGEEAVGQDSVEQFFDVSPSDENKDEPYRPFANLG